MRAELTMVCDPETFSPGTSLILLQVEVHYHAAGLDRVARVPLIDPVQITLPGG